MSGSIDRLLACTLSSMESCGASYRSLSTAAPPAAPQPCCSSKTKEQQGSFDWLYRPATGGEKLKGGLAKHIDEISVSFPPEV